MLGLLLGAFGWNGLGACGSPLAVVSLIVRLPCFYEGLTDPRE